MKRKTGLYLTMCLIIAVGFIAGCKTPQDTSNTPCLTCEKTTTLQGTVFDAITGKRIGGTDLTMLLRQGVNTRRPDLLYTGVYTPPTKNWWEFWVPTPIVDNATKDGNKYLIGDYAFKNIPSYADNAEGGNDYRNDNPEDRYANFYQLHVFKTGYQEFVAVIGEYEGPNALGNLDNVVGNVYLFPDDKLAPCYTIDVVTEGTDTPISGATVNLCPMVEQNWEEYGAEWSEFTLYQDPGNLACLSKTTDATGIVAFCGSDGLKLGAAYMVCVDELKFESVNYEYTCLDKGSKGGSGVIQIGWGAKELEIEMAPTDNWPNDYGLYVTTLSNEVEDSIINSTDPKVRGTLTMTFNRPIRVKDAGDLGWDPTIENQFFATVGHSPIHNGAVWDGLAWTDGAPIAPSTLTVKRVTWAISPDNLTLTLTPNWATAPLDDQSDVWIEYFDAVDFSDATGSAAGVGATPGPFLFGPGQHIIVQGYPDSRVSLFGDHDHGWGGNDIQYKDRTPMQWHHKVHINAAH